VEIRSTLASFRSRYQSRFERVRLRVTFFATLVIILVATVLLFRTVSHTIAKERRERLENEARSVAEIIVRELQGDQGSTILANLPTHGSRRRTTYPIVFPEYFFRYFYTADDRRRRIAPRPTWVPNPTLCVRPEILEISVGPRSAEPQSDDFAINLCSAIVPNAAYGRYVFVVIEMAVTEPQESDLSTTTDFLELVGRSPNSTRRLRLGFSSAVAHNMDTKIFDIVATEDFDGIGRRATDVSGQAYHHSRDRTQATKRSERSPGKLVVLIRLSYDSLVGGRSSQEWPPEPEELKAVSFSVAKHQYRPSSRDYRTVTYGPMGEGTLSLPRLLGERSRVVQVDLIDRDGRNDQVIWSSRTSTTAADEIGARFFSKALEMIRPMLVASVGELASPIVMEQMLQTGSRFVVRVRADMNEELDDLNPIVALFLAIVLFISLAFLVFWVRVLDRVVTLHRRAREWGRDVGWKKSPFELSAQEQVILKSRDELGLLAREFTGLIRTTMADANTREVRAWQETQRGVARNQILRAVGHEIRTPLQALLTLIDGNHTARRYVNQIKRAVDLLSGARSVVDAFETRKANVAIDDIAAFARSVAQNAKEIGVADTIYFGPAEAVLAEFDAELLEDALTHILNNSNRERVPGTSIRIMVNADDTYVRLSIENEGPTIDPGNLERIFEYGFTTRQTQDGENDEALGQGLFVARVSIAKQGGELKAFNLEGGVVFVISFARVKD
jgi:signal transduction histidine kinase